MQEKNYEKNTFDSKNREKFKQAIETSGYSYKKLGEMLEVNSSTLHHFVTGRRRPSLEIAAKIEKFFELPASDWLN